MEQLNTRIVLRNDSTAKWLENSTQVLLQGEVGIEFLVDGAVKIKIGDGIKSWAELSYFGGEQLIGDNNSIVIENGVIKLKGVNGALEEQILVSDGKGGLIWKSAAELAGIKVLSSSIAANTLKIVALENTIGKPSTENEEGTGLIFRLETIEKALKNIYTKEEIDNLISTVYHYRGSVANYSDLPVENLKVGDVWNIENDSLTHGIKAGDNVAWNGESWDKLAGTVDLSGYATNEKVDKIAENVTVIMEDYASKEEVRKLSNLNKYEILDTPKGTLVDIGEKEIRIMCPANAEYHKQAVGAGGDANLYYITLRTYAPNEEAVGYIETLNGAQDPEVLYDLREDAYGRKFQPTWLAVARYDEATDSWSYYGDQSSIKKYIGYSYQIDWYNADGLKIASDSIRINLSNKDCHYAIEPYYMASINVNRLSQTEGEYLVLYGGSASDNI